MTSNNIPDGHGVIAGRGRTNARIALHAANLAGVDPALVRTTQDGYLVPEAVLDFHEQARAEIDSTVGAAVENADTTETDENKAPAKTDAKGVWEAWATKNHGYDTAEGLTKAQLIERFGDKEE